MTTFAAAATTTEAVAPPKPLPNGTLTGQSSDSDTPGHAAGDAESSNGNKENKHVTANNGTKTAGIGGPKSKWVPLPIDLPKTRGRRDRSPPRRRRYDDYDDEYYADRPPARNANNRYNRSSRGYRTTSQRGPPPVRRTGPRGGGSGGGGSKRPTGRGSQGGDGHEYRDFSNGQEFTGGSGGKGKVSGEAPPFMMPYLGTYYYNGAPLFSMVNTNSIKDCIKKQM